MLIPVYVDYSQPFSRSDKETWEAEYKAKEEASEAEWDRRLAQRVAEGPLRLKHYGIWHPSAGWLADSSDFIFCTTNRKLAWAQAAHLWSRPGYSKLWHVVCIEEWTDEQQTKRPAD